MQTVAFICEKGGVGKTTIALSLAVAAAKAGETVVVIDIDGQVSATNWRDRRQTNDIEVISAQPARLSHVIEDARRRFDPDLIVIDTAGKTESAGQLAARSAQLVFVPVEAAPKAMETLSKSREIITAAGSPPAFVVLNKIHPQGDKAATELKEVMEAFCGIPACPVHFTSRAAYNAADLTGQTPQETDPRGKAAVEAQDLYLFTVQQRKADNGTKQHSAIHG